MTAKSSSRLHKVLQLLQHPLQLVRVVHGQQLVEALVALHNHEIMEEPMTREEGRAREVRKEGTA